MVNKYKLHTGGNKITCLGVTYYAVDSIKTGKASGFVIADNIQQAEAKITELNK